MCYRVARFNANSDRANLNCNEDAENSNASLEVVQAQRTMKRYNHLFEKVYSLENLNCAWRKARKGKTKKKYVIEFERNLENNLDQLKQELITQTYTPRKLNRFIIKDPKTRVIHSSYFRDRIVHHALVNILEPIYERIFISDSIASRKEKGALYGIRRFDKFKRKVSQNGKLIQHPFSNNSIQGFCLKADIKHYFQTVNQEILLTILSKKIKDKKVINLIKVILQTYGSSSFGMPLGNLTSQFFANVYLNELDYFIKHKLEAKYYLRYVDDFVILHESKNQLEIWKQHIELFLENRLKLSLHKQKSKIIPLSKGIDFVGFRNFYYFKLLRKRNVRIFKRKIHLLKKGIIQKEKFIELSKGWEAYAKWANTYKFRLSVLNNLE